MESARVSCRPLRIFLALCVGFSLTLRSQAFYFPLLLPPCSLTPTFLLFLPASPLPHP